MELVLNHITSGFEFCFNKFYSHIRKIYYTHLYIQLCKNAQKIKKTMVIIYNLFSILLFTGKPMTKPTNGSIILLTIYLLCFTDFIFH